MLPDSPPAWIFKLLLDEVLAVLKPVGYRRQGSNFILREKDAIGLIGLQRSIFNSKSDVKFTANVGVMFEKCIEPWCNSVSVVKRPSAMYLHVNERLGFLMPEHCDRWWEIRADTNASDLVNDFVPKVSEYAVPFVQRHLKVEDVLDMLRRGHSPPGMNEHTREEFLVQFDPTGGE